MEVQVATETAQRNHTIPTSRPSLADVLRYRMKGAPLRHREQGKSYVLQDICYRHTPKYIS